MAEIGISVGGAHKKNHGVKKGKKLSTRVDLTPMVDLGFLLITFFIFTTTMGRQRITPIYLPKDTKDSTKVKSSGALTLMLGKYDQIYYYEGDSLLKLKSTDYKKVRDLIIDKKIRTNPADFFVIIKPTREATYKNTVNILDEMAINGVKRYAMVDISPVEYDFIRKSETATDLK